MSEKLQSMVHIIELYGRGLGALGRAIHFSVKGAAKGVDVEKVKTMQCKMKLSRTGENGIILSAEQVKGYQSGEEFIPVSFDVETEILTDSPNIYAVVLPGMSEDGESTVMIFNENEEKIKEYSQKNEELAAVCLKQQRERSGKGMAPELGQLQEVTKSMLEIVVSGKGY